MSFIAHEGGSLSNVADGVGVRGAQTKCRDRPRLKRLVGVHLVLREQVIVLSRKVHVSGVAEKHRSADLCLHGNYETASPFAHASNALPLTRTARRRRVDLNPEP